MPTITRAAAKEPSGEEALEYLLETILALEENSPTHKALEEFGVETLSDFLTQ